MADKQEQNQESVNLEENQESSVLKLRQRWELASVLNFFNVFEPLIGKELKMSAEEIEDALINPNASLAHLHVILLKGIPPVNNKKLSEPDGWVTILCKKLAEWWPWVAEGEVPLIAAKGEEIARYKELDPITRLLILKALCEIRTEQDDLVSYINDALKQGEQPSQFRKDKIGEDKNGISYWYDGNSVIGHRLYREVYNVKLKQKNRGKNNLDMQKSFSEWETLATNLDEFRKVSEEMSSCQVGVEAAVHEIIETEVISVLEKIQKKKERDLKRRQREETILSGCHSYAAGVTRSCRTRGPVKYTFDEFDRTIDEAIKLTRNRKGREVKRNDSKHQKHGKRGVGASDGDSAEGPPGSTSEDEENGQQDEENNNDKDDDIESEGTQSDEENGQGEDSENDEEDYKQGESGEDDLGSEGSDKNEDTKCTSDNAAKNKDAIVTDSDTSDFEQENSKLLPGGPIKKSSDCASNPNLWETRSPEAKNRNRQRPVRNTAFIVSDSEDGSLSGNMSGDALGEGDPSVVSDTEDELSG